MASEIRVNQIQNRSGLSTVTFSDTGAIVSGIVTANSFSGSGANLTNLPAGQLTGALPAISGANLTGIDSSTLKFGNDVKVAANNSGAIVTGILTSIKAVGIGTTTTAGRNAGVGTAVGTLIFNSTDNQLQVYANNLQWRGFSPVDPTLSSISGTLYVGQASTLTLAGTNFLTSNLQVRFVQATRSVDATVTVTPSSGTAASVAVPASVYNNVQAADVVSITVTNNDGGVSNTVTKTAAGLPTGGTITTSGSYRIHTFTSNGNFVVPTGTTLNNVEYLIVAGGGGGGPSNHGHQGGGGGAGGLRTSVVGATSGRGSSAEARVTYTAGTYAASIGAGGASRAQGGGYGHNGINSSLATPSGTITATGGGGGGMGQNNGASRGGLNGGCGGGAASSDQSIAAEGSGTAGQGYDGGQPTCVGCGRGGAGGGAGGVGTDGGSGGVASSNTAGGVGLVNNITGSNVTYATGGDCPGTAGGNQNPGAANTGNGGDGGYTNNNSSTGQAGGSGIVIVRYVL